MPDRTTIALIILAGNENTVFQTDPLLTEVQAGLMAIALNSNQPDVYCLYLRRSAIGRQFTIGTNTRPMNPDGSGGLTNFPPSDSVALHGSVNSQVMKFLKNVNQQLTESGPVHVLIAAHGDPVRGFRLSLMGLSTTPIRPGNTVPDLTLDETAMALEQLNGRVGSMILHSCNLSGIESMCALSIAKHHIACEGELGLSMKLSKWFSTLCDPVATPEKITTDCFKSMDDDPGNALGCFSSHLVPVRELLEKLDALGSRLSLLLNSNTPETAATAEVAIADAQTISGVENHTVDIVRFCRHLSENTTLAVVERQVAAAVANTAESPSVRLGLIKTDSWKTSTKYKAYGGISMYLPHRLHQYYSTDLLPNSFRTGAPDWISFVNLWGGTET